jgi:RHS repeat-associated protein
VNLNNDNRLGVPSGQNKIMHYDANGNLDNDTYTGAGNRTYDAENRITSAFGGVAPGQAELYTYDASGQRVKRTVDGVETWMVYGLAGELVAEYPANIAALTPQKEYGYRNGTMLITAEAGGASAAPVFSDNFDDNSLNANSWSVYYPGGSPTVSEQSQQLQMTLSPNTAAYNGVYSNATYDLTNRMVQVESVQSVSQAGWCENFLEVELNANNYLMIQVGAGNMIFRSRVNGVNDQTSIPFDGTANRFWRIRHDQSTNQIFFETSANNTVWLTRKTVTAGFSVTSLRFDLLAGAYGTGNSSPGAAKYDNFKLLASSAPTSLTVPNAGFEAPVLGNGNFQYSPTGGSWSFAGGGGISGMNSPFTGVPSAAPDGVQVAFIQAGGTVQQLISGFQANANYVITFSAIQRTNCCNTTGQDIAVYIDNTLVGTFHPSNTAYVEYSTAVFSTTTGAHTVKFAGLNVNGDQTAFMDKVRITGSPKPGFGVQWLVADQLGTARMIFDETGALANVKRHDYLPFGEELFAGVSGRTVTEGYGSGDGVRQQFTGKERDVETGLDYFLARYYSSTQGRFTSPDPYKIVAEVQNEPNPEKAKSMFVHYLMQPQLWNQYAYTINNPLKYTDPTGEVVELTGTEEEQRAALARIRAMLGEERFALLNQQIVNGHIQLSISANDVQRFAAIGGSNADERAFSAGMAGILVRTSIVEFKIAEQFQYKDPNGKVHTGYTGNGCFLFSECGNGGITLNPSQNASGNGNWQIFVNPQAGKAATAAAAGVYSITDGKGSLVSSNDMVDAHEFGHVWETWQGPYVIDTNPRTKPYLKPDSVIFENAIRSRYPSPLRRTQH